MSLGSGDPRRQRLVGALLLVLLGGGIALLLSLSGRALGDGLSFQVELARAGALRPGARIRLAGRVMGEVRGMHREEATRHVVLDCFVTRRYAGDIDERSDPFVATPSVLGEAWLEVGPPRDGGKPGPPLREGQRLRGSDPPALDELLPRLHQSLGDTLRLVAAHRLELDELVQATLSLLGTLSGIPVEPGELQRTRRQASQALDAAQALGAALAAERIGPRTVALWHELHDTLESLRPELAATRQRAELAAARVETLAALTSPEQRAQAQAALSRMARALRSTEALVDGAEQLWQGVEQGRGTLGGFQLDRELFDDLHETHRILKHQAWRLIFKPKARHKAEPDTAPAP